MTEYGREAAGMEDCIRIEELEIFAHHGVYPEEQRDGQKFYINAELFTKTRPAGMRDDLSLSTDYGEVCHFMDAFVKEHTWKLIETVAEQLAEALLLRYDRIERVSLEIRKPSAPVGLPFGSVSVRINRAWHTAYVALGSNLGDRKNYLDTAVKKIKENRLIRVKKVSDWIVTKPYGGVEQDDFLNGAAELKTLLTPEELLDFLHTVESEAERKREIHWGPRTLDLDILFYDQDIIHSENLTVPHLDLHNRIFVLEPMCQIAPWYGHPLLHKTMRELLDDLR